jgi:hypothetical protein
MRIGAPSISKVMLGSVEASRLYIGANQVWPGTVVTQLGTSYDFSVLSSAASTFVGSCSANLFAGGASSAPAIVIGSAQHYNNATSAQAIIDSTAAYNYYKGLTPVGNAYLGASPTPTAASPLISGDIVNTRFTPGVFFGSGAVTNSGTITFDAGGDSNAQFVMQFGAAYTPAASANVILVNGAQSKNIFFVITGAFAPGASAQIRGTHISLGASTMATGVAVDGRIMTTGAGAISLTNNVITTT